MSHSDGYLKSLGRRWWIVLIVLVAAIGTALFFTSRQRSVYRASTTLVVKPSGLVQETETMLRSLATLERRSVIATFAKIPGTRRVKESVAKSLDLTESEVRRYKIHASVIPNTNIISLQVLGPKRDMVAEVARAAASKTQREALSLYRVFALEPLEGPVAPRRPIYPNPQRNAVAAAILGLFLGIGAALVFDRLRRPATAAERADPRASDGRG